jgi:hypothetical protein
MTKQRKHLLTQHMDWFFYHDALSQMTCSETGKWMKEQGYYKRWLLPQSGVNDGIS